MSTRLIVDEHSELREGRTDAPQPQPAVIRMVATVLSYVFHPLFIPVYIIAFLMAVHPYFFDNATPMKKMINLLRFFIMYSFFPLVTVLLAKALDFLDSIHLKTQRERIIPYIASGIFYFWMSYVLRNQPEFSKEIVQLSIAIFLASSIGLLVNIYMKVSMHGMAMGILVFFIGMLALNQPMSYSVYLSIAILIAGLVCTARLIVSDHSSKEVYTGLFVGAASMLLAVWVDGILP